MDVVTGVGWEFGNQTAEAQQLSLLSTAQDALRQIAPNTGSYLNEVYHLMIDKGTLTSVGQSV
jgi:hypothetical protein